jgi:tetratricopeptide (TPR) repeat protein
MNRHERRAAGKRQRTASGTGARTPAALCELAHRHLQAGRTLDAQICCQQALATDSGFADALHLMGLLALRAEQPDHAIEWFSRAVQHDQRPAYLLSLGNTLRRQGRLEEAFRPLDRAVEIDIESAEAWKALARLLADLNRHHEATLSFQHVLKLDPRDGDAACQAGLLLLQSGKPEEALALLDRSDQLQPTHAPTAQMRGLVLQTLGRVEEAHVEMCRAHALDPGEADTCNNMGVLLRKLGRPEEALTWFDKALQLRPDFTAAHGNKAYTLGRQHRFHEALAIYAAVKAANPDSTEMDWNAALLQLLTGNFEAGWAGREARWNVPGLPIAKYSFWQPMWLGKEPIGGKTILIHQDEGLGDAIQFARYVPMVAALGARVILLVADSLVPLLSRLPGVAECIPRSADRHVAFDTYCGIGSLPLAFGTRLEAIPASVPYLQAADESRVQAWKQRLGAHDKLRVGLVWSGNPKHGDDHNRSLALRALSPLFDLDATFVSLQKDPRPEDQASLRERPGIVDLTVHLTDFAETAALVSCLDLVITVDTSMAHLAGAMACPTWILLPYTPDYRWMLDRDDSPWYPTARLFRQDATHDYRRVIERVRSELSARIAAWLAGQKSG